MPHCIIEYSDNLPDRPDWRELMANLHKMLQQTGLFKLNDLKSRVVKHDTYYIGDGNSDRVFVTLDIQILSGRDSDVKANISEAALKIMNNYFPLAKEKSKFSLTAQISELDRESYRKIVNYK